MQFQLKKAAHPVGYQWVTTGITLIHISRVQSSGSPRGLCLYTSAEFLSQANLKPYQVYIHVYRLGSLENSLWYQYLNNLLFLLLELHLATPKLHLHTKTLLLGLLTEQSTNSLHKRHS